jgi:hypothetical protein
MKQQGRVVPEERLPPMMLGAVMLPAGLFWFAWTSSPHITWVPQVLAGIPIGMGIFMIFMQGINYIIDVSCAYLVSSMVSIAIFQLFPREVLFRDQLAPFAPQPQLFYYPMLVRQSESRLLMIRNE